MHHQSRLVFDHRKRGERDGSHVGSGVGESCGHEGPLVLVQLLWMGQLDGCLLNVTRRWGESWWSFSSDLSALRYPPRKW